MINYSNIKRIMAAALLVFFTMPSTIALSDSYSGAASMTLNGNVNLTQSNELITLSLRDSDIKQVLRMFADKAGMNIVFHNSVDGKVTLDLVKTPINEAFDLVLQIGGLNYYKQGNTMIIMSKSSEENAAFSKQEMMVFPIKYVGADKIADFLNKNVFSMKRAGLSGVDAATVNPAKNELIIFGMPSDASIVEKVIEQFDREPYTRTFAVNHTTPAEMADMICNLLLPSRGVGTGSSDSGASGGGEAPAMGSPEDAGMTGGAAGIMTGGAADSSGGGEIGELKLGEGVVACSMSSSASGSVSAFNMQNLSIAYYPQRGTITLMGGSEAQAAMIEKFIKDNDIKQPQAYLEVAILELNEAGSKEFENQWQVYSRHWRATFDGEGTTAGSTLGNLYGNYYPGTTYVDQYDDGGVLTGQNAIDRMLLFPSGIKVSWVMNYIISNRKGRVLANPKILITNGQNSIIDLTSDYVEKVTSEYLTSSLAGAGSTGTVQRTYSIGNDLGIKVSLVPFISPEGYVTLNIQPEYATISDRVYANGETSQRELAATLLSRRNLDLKNVRIKDGETLVIGGMIQETEQKTTSKIPFLGDLPLVGPIFRSTSTEKQKNELVIMITPNIINDGEGAVADSI